MGDRRPGPKKCKEDVVVNKNNGMWYGCGTEMKKEEMNEGIVWIKPTSKM